MDNMISTLTDWIVWFQALVVFLIPYAINKVFTWIHI